MSGRRVSLLVGAALLALGGVLGADSVVNSKHNLSVTGPGTVKALAENQVCLFCHAPHDSSPVAPLWNRYDGGMPYTPYSSSTAFSSPGQPTGASKLCLSCHDGTIALGMVRSRASEIPFPGTGKLDSGASFLGTDLSDDHPVSFAFNQTLYTQQGQLTDPALLTGAVRLDGDGYLQCTSCHDPHDDQYGKFLVMDNMEAALCTTCHAPTDWDGFAFHRLSTASWNLVPPNPWPHTPWPTVALNSCENCHRPHGAASPQRLAVFAPSEQGCLVCHNGNVAGKNLAAEFSKSSVHPVAASELHEPREDLLNPPRHSECADCHNPHAAGGYSPTLAGSLYGVRGQSAAGLARARIDYEYELCFRCHADSADLGGPPLVNRRYPQPNTRQEFSTANPSYHPVLGSGKNPDVPSLLPPWTTNSIMACTDCHNNNDLPGAPGTAAYGPHGSIYRPILERQLVLTNGSTESAAVYALCYKCHDRDSILGNVAGNISFLEHEKHITAPVNATCLTCHDPHGVQPEATSTNHLINFNPDYVTASSGGRLEFIDNGSRAGTCYLTCHGENHNPYTYVP